MAERPDELRRLEDLEGEETEEHLQRDTAEDVDVDGEPRPLGADDPVGWGHSLAPPS